MTTPEDGLETRGLTTNEEALAIVEQMQRKFKEANPTPDTESVEVYRNPIAHEKAIRITTRLDDEFFKGRFSSSGLETIESFVEEEITTLLTSRDTYWKERVRKEVEAEREKIREKIQNLSMIDEKYAHWAKKEILGWCFPPITNEDNLK